MKKTICKIAIIMILIAISYPLKSQAALQANKNGTSITVTSTIYASHLFTGIRAMEVGTVGKAAQDAADGIDCHMAKNTEWGTAAMLSASIYGEAPNGNKIDASTTGNESGVYQMAGSTGSGNSMKGTELVAGIWTGKTNDQYIGTIAKADPKYYDLYSSKTSIPGDATTETAGWKGSTTSTFIESSIPIFQRGYNSLFGYHYHNGYGYYYGGYCTASTRAVAVCGSGL